MGRSAIQKPARLAEKLLEIRQRLNLSQNQLIRFLGFEDKLTQAEISAFERGVRVPPLIVLLRYARSVGINVEVLIDDELEMPKINS
jgi:transcriptional regulator with XRE-family HTH domain